VFLSCFIMLFELGYKYNNNGDTLKEIKRRTSIALQKLKQMKKLWAGQTEQQKLDAIRLQHMHVKLGHLIKQLRNTLTPLNTNAIDEFLKYHGLRKEQTNPFDRNDIFLKVGY
jgi:hypothetical protein